MNNKNPNHLAGETSPYLLQHAYNPVDWYPWNETALNKAREENKLMLISIGYAACHWCHVMEKESFEDPEVAAAMNTDYIAIKVDREERPDVDQVYMYAAYVVTGRGGWPLNVIALPDGRPVYAGTYFRKIDWLNVLNHFSVHFKINPEELSRQAEEIYREIRRFDKAPVSRNPIIRNPEELERLFSGWLRILDFSEGGTKGAPKFPMPSNLEFLLHYGMLTKNHDALRAVELTLDKMAAGGIFDQIGGGFSRYSVDDHWHIPHFEKMLYDNAQLVSIYSKAYRHFRKSRYEEIVRATIGFIERGLTSPYGLFYSSLDADSEGVEGEFYTWKSAEVDQNLGEKSGLFKEYFSITEEGNWEDGRNVLHIAEEDVGLKYSMSNEQLKTMINESIDVLLKVRKKRIPPALDDKIITSWNALMIIGYIDAYKAFGDDIFLQRAEKAALNYKKMLDENNQLLRLHQKAKSEKRKADIERPASSPANAGFPLRPSIQHQSAFLDDYASLIKAFLDIYQVTFDNNWLSTAEKLIDFTVSHFFDSASGFFFFTSDTDPVLIDRKMELSDNVIPSSNSTMALSLFIYGQITGKSKWSALAKGMLEKMMTSIFGNPSFHSIWSVLLTHILIPPVEIAIVGDQYNAFLDEINKPYYPHLFFYGGINESGYEMLKGKEVPGKTMIYVCREQTCSEPFDSAEKVLQYLQTEFEHG